MDKYKDECESFGDTRYSGKTYVSVNENKTPNRIDKYVKTVTSTEPCKDPNFVMVVSERLIQLDIAINKLEYLRNSLIPDEPDSGVCEQKVASSSFDYVWGSLPDSLFSYANRINKFCDFIHELIYKETTKASCCDNMPEPSHLEKANIACYDLARSIERLEAIPDQLADNQKPTEERKEIALNFVTLWKTLPGGLDSFIDRIHKVNTVITEILLGMENYNQKK